MHSSFRKKLTAWYNPDARNLPWKKTGDAYKIWLSEIILQQTRVEQGTPYYIAFVKKYPTIKKLADAPLDEVLKLWEGLGYYSRARNLHAAAKQVMEQHQGKFPETHEELLQLKGIGHYTAAAIASFAYNLPHAVLDGNVYRVLARVFGIEIPIDSTEGKKQFEKLAARLLDKKDPARYNQAIMDFGSLVCKPKIPLCNQCPFSSDCKALELNKISLLPLKAKRLIKTERYFHYFVLYDSKYIYLKQRTEKDIWKGLYELPMVEKVDSRQSIVDRNYLIKNLQIPSLGLWTMARQAKKFTYRQVLSHQHINGNFYEIKTNKLPKMGKSYLKISKSLILNYAFPKIVRTYLQDRLNFLS